jgi:hypothetical protein
MPRARNLWQIAGDMRPVSITASSTLPFSRNARAIISAALSTFIEAIFLPVSATMQACAKAEWLSFDIAILDVNLNGQHTFPIADSLKERGLPLRVFNWLRHHRHSGVPSVGADPSEPFSAAGPRASAANTRSKLRLRNFDPSAVLL